MIKHLSELTPAQRIGFDSRLSRLQNLMKKDRNTVAVESRMNGNEVLVYRNRLGEVIAIEPLNVLVD